MNVTYLKQVIFNTTFLMGERRIQTLARTDTKMVKGLKAFITGSGGYCKYALYIEKPTELSLHIHKGEKLRHLL